MSNYNSKDIIVLDGLDAVRLRPGMYIGTTGVKGMHHLLWEIVDNGVDELSNGHGFRLTVTMHKDNSITVMDDGRGIPVDKHPKLKVRGVEVVFKSKPRYTFNAVGVNELESFTLHLTPEDGLTVNVPTVSA